jgi:hypothetical protein
VDGATLGQHTTSLRVAQLPMLSRSVRMEVRGADGSTVFVQPYLLRQRGDVNGDFRIDSADDAICRAVAAGRDTSPAHVAACLALARSGGN